MYNTIKMELYRMVRMKSFYVIMLIMTAMTVFGTWAINEEVAYNKEEAQKTEQSLNAIQQGVGENQEIEDIMDGIEAAQQNPGENQEEAEDGDDIMVGIVSEMSEDTDFSNVTVLDTAFSNLSGMIIALFIAIFTVLFCGADITSGYIKNFVGQAKSRTRLVLAKVISIGIYTIVMMLFYWIVQMVSNGIFLGYIHMGDVGSCVSYLAVQTVLHIALAMLCLAIVLISKSTVTSMVFAICVCGNIMSVLYMGIDFIVGKIGVKDFSFSTYTVSGRIKMLEQTFARQDGIETLAVAAVCMILCFLIGSVVFTKKDI